MTARTTVPFEHPVVVAGLGFTGGELARAFDWPAGSCVTSRRADATADLPVVRFDWGNPETWNHLPRAARALIVTIPPVLRDDVNAERERLERWADWMAAHRPACRRVVYVSTTGVYPQRDGVWDEACAEPPDTESGVMRVMTERLLRERFDARIVRAGGIYGPGRNVVTRALEGKPMARTDRPVHRIHVHDLARICVGMLGDDIPGPVINAVDAEPARSADALAWAAEQAWCPEPDRVRAAARSAPRSAPAAHAGPGRVIDSARLRRWWCEGAWVYPTFREGLRRCFGDDSAES